jgi:hypothetical protein
VIGTPLTYSITKYGRPLTGSAPASNTLAMCGLIHPRQRLSLGFEAAHDLRRIHAELDQL